MGNHQELDKKFLKQYFNYKLAKNFDLSLFVKLLGVYVVSYIPIYFAPQPLKVLIHGSLILIILYYTNNEAYPLLFIMTIGTSGMNQLLDIYIYQEASKYFVILAFIILSIIVYLKNLMFWRHFLALSNELVPGEADLRGRFIVANGIITGSNKKFCSMIKKEGYCFAETKPTLQSLLEDDEFNKLNELMQRKTSFSCSIRFMNDFDYPLEFLISVTVNTKGPVPIYLFSVAEPLKRIGDNLKYIQNNYSIVSNFSGISIIERDVSKLQQAMRVIKEKGVENKADFKKYCYQNPKIIYELSSMPTITNLNDECVKLFEGENKQEVIDYIQGEPEMHVEDFVNSLSYLFEETDYRERETFLITMKNNRKDVLMKSKYPTKEVFNFITVIIDITDSKIAKEKLIESEEKYEALFQSGPLGDILHEDGVYSSKRNFL